MAKKKKHHHAMKLDNVIDGKIAFVSGDDEREQYAEEPAAAREEARLAAGHVHELDERLVRLELAGLAGLVKHLY